MRLSDIVVSGAASLGIELTPTASAAFETYAKFLEEKGENLNLTAIREPEAVARLHFIDSLALLKSAEFVNARVIDIGSGAGFPGLPLKIAQTNIELTLLDATAKKVRFLSDLCAELNISAKCIHSRAEELAHKTCVRERYDIAASRAVAQLNALCELCLPFLSVGGVFLAMKGHSHKSELGESLSAMRGLGAEYERTDEYVIPGTDIKRSVVVIRKTAATPNGYPRRFPKILRVPL